MSETSASELDLLDLSPNWLVFVLFSVLLSIANSFTALLPLPLHARQILALVSFSITAILVTDCIYLFLKAPKKRHFIFRQSGWMVLLGVLPTLHFLRIIWFHRLMKRRGQRVRDFLSRTAIRKNPEGTLLAITFAAIVVFQFSVVAIVSFEEPVPDSNINSVSDAIWWSIATAATVGYGDHYPVTNGGRIVGIALMAVGIALFSTVTGSLVEWFRDHPLPLAMTSDDEEEQPVSESLTELRELLDEQENEYLRMLARVRERIDRLENHIDASDSN